MKSKSKYLVKRNLNLIDNYQSIISLLYGPIISNDAVCLYFILNSNVNGISYDVERLCTLANLDINKLESALKKLEEYGLINSLYNKNDDSYLFMVNSPLSANDFFKHQIYSRIYLNTVGNQQYQLSQAFFVMNDVDTSDYVDITQKIDLSVLNNWNESQEKQYQSCNNDVNETIDFDYQSFLLDLSPLVFPVSLRTKENLDVIGKLASDFAISADEMKKLVGKSTDIKTNVFDTDKLKKLCINNKTVDLKEVDDPYQDNPVSFLYRKQMVALSAADKRLIDYLINELKMKREVVNYLIETTLENTNGKLNKDYVEKVATTWIRQNIDTLQKAKDQQQNTNNSKTKVYFSADEMKAEDQDIDALREKMFGGK